MASSCFSVPCPKNLNNINTNTSHFKPTSCFHSGSSSLRITQPRNQNCVMKVSAQLNEISHGKSSNSALSSEKSDDSSKVSSSKTTVPDITSLSAFMNEVAGLVKLVDSRDIIQLQLKQDDCEVHIRKKEDLPPPPAPPMMMMQSSQTQAMFQSQPPPPQAAPASSPPPSSASAPASPSPAKPKFSLPPLKSPMAGTFYRSPAPGAPSFVKVGDKVQKGQVVCIIEAMKLMNEIEADQSGTIVDIIAEDGKPVSLDSPLLIIEP